MSAIAGGKQEEALFSAATFPQVAVVSVEWLHTKKMCFGGKRENLADQAD